MKYILQGANIFATNLCYMNDSEEYSNGLRELKEIINKKLRQELITEEFLEQQLKQDVTKYSISFSTKKDLLSQWSMYAGESGVSLAMEFSGDERYKAYNENGERENVTYRSMKPREVYYCTQSTMKKEEYNKVATEIWKAIKENNDTVTLSDFQGNFAYIWTEMTPYVKRYEFSAEEEYRLVFDWTQLLKNFRIDYRNDRNVLKPYLDIECVDGWPIYEITVGPGFNQDVVFKSILHFLNNGKIKLPELNGTEYIKRCKNYFDSCGKMPTEAKTIWENRKCDLKEAGKKNRYEVFLGIRNEVIESVDKTTMYAENLLKKEVTREGVILSKSGIPYIF